jgi:hypothetical protein
MWRGRRLSMRSGFAEEAHDAIPDERFGAKRLNELSVGIDDRHHVVLRRPDRRQFDHLLLNPTAHRWQRPLEVDRDSDEWKAHEHAR